MPALPFNAARALSKDVIIHIYPPDSKMVYSDLGMILLSDMISKITSSSLDKLSSK